MTKTTILKPLILLSGFLFLCALAHASSPLFYYSLAEVALDQGQYETADSLLEIAFRIDPSSEEVIVERLNVLYYLRNNKRLISFAEDVLAKGIVLQEVYIMLADSYLATGDAKKAKEILSEGLQHTDEPGPLYLEFYRIALKEENGTEAMQYLHRVESETNDPNLLYQVAMEYSRLQDNIMSEMTLRRVLALDPKFSQAHVYLGDFYYNNKEFYKSIKELEFLLENSQEATMISMRQLLLSYYFTHQFEQVLGMSDYFPLELMDSMQKRMFFFAAYKAQKFSVALEYGEALLAEKETMEPDRLQELYEMMAVSEIQLQNYEQANDYFGKISDERFLLPHLNIIPFIVNETGDVSLFHTLLDYAESNDADTLSCTLKALLAYNYAKMDSLDLSKKYISKIDLQLCTDNYPIVLLSYAKLKTGISTDSVYAFLEMRPNKEMTSAQWLGQYYADIEDIEVAEHYFSQALGQDSTNLDLYLNVAQFYNEHGMFGQEITTLEQGMKFFPENADILNWLGYSLTEHDIRLEEARWMLEKAVALAPDNIYIWDSLGWLYYKLGLYEDALNAMQLLIDADVDDSVICYHLGVIYWKNGITDKAKELLQCSIDFNNNEEALGKAQEALGKIE